MPALTNPKQFEIEYFLARKEHAFLLRCEGLTLKSIGERLGITKQQVNVLRWSFARQLARAMRKTKVGIFPNAT